MDNNQVDNEENIIMPTMLDEVEEKRNEHQDLSTIIPDSKLDDNNSNLIQIDSRDIELKSDGSVILAKIENNNIIFDDGLSLPKPIDIEKRKKELKEEKDLKKVHKKKKISDFRKEDKKRNVISAIALVIIIALSFIIYRIFKRPSESDFKVLNLTIELGESLPSAKKNYVKPALGTFVDDMKYYIDTSNVVLDEVGQYQFTVRYNNISKNGFINIVDTTPPKISLRDVLLTEGQTYSAESFISDCLDYTGCNYSYEKPEEDSNYTKPGTYSIYISAVDAYDNKTTKKAKLTIEAIGMVKKYIKIEDNSNEKGYQKTTIYDLHFSNFDSSAVLNTGTVIIEYVYKDKEQYLKDKELYYAEINYSYDDKKLILKETNEVKSIDNNTTLDKIDNYLKNKGFTEK